MDTRGKIQITSWLNSVKKIIKTPRPAGVWILGAVNFFIFGVVSLVSALYVYINISSSGTGKILEELQKNFPDISVDPEQFKIAVLFQIAVAVIFVFSGYGLILRKEWARKLTLYFSFFMVAVAFITALFNSALVAQAIIQIVYPGVLIIYFTNKKIEKFFSSSQINDPEKEKRID